MILAIDPGVRGCGIALFDGHVLSLARYVKNSSVAEASLPAVVRGMAQSVCGALAVRGVLTSHVRHLVVEWPQVYQGAKQKGRDPNDLLALSAVDGAIAALFPTAICTRYLPREWKGQVPPNECARRIVARLSLDERGRVDRLAEFHAALERAIVLRKEVGGTDHNTIDAIGIGLKQIGRFEPIRVG
jgi:hypothetical protein